MEVVVFVSFYRQGSSLFWYRDSGTYSFLISSGEDDDDNDAVATVINLLMPASYVSLLYKNALSSSLVWLDTQIVVFCISDNI